MVVHHARQVHIAQIALLHLYPAPQEHTVLVTVSNVHHVLQVVTLWAGHQYAPPAQQGPTVLAQLLGLHHAPQEHIVLLTAIHAHHAL